MASGRQSSRWLFLEQQSDVDEWATEHNLKWCLAAADRVMSSTKLSEYREQCSDKIVVLFLAEERREALPVHLKRELTASEPWRVWCHYGGSIAAEGRDGLGERWKHWGGVTEEDGNLIRRANEGIEPYPYSRSQKTLPWSREIDTVKKCIRDAGADGLKSTWRSVVGQLEQAWETVDETAAFERLVLTLTELLPAVLAGRLVRDVLVAEGTGDIPEAVEQVIKVYQSSGFSDCKSVFAVMRVSAPIKELKERYEEVEAVFGELSYARKAYEEAMEGRSEQRRGLRDKLTTFRRQLARFDRSYRAISKKVSSRMYQNGNVRRARRGL